MISLAVVNMILTHLNMKNVVIEKLTIKSSFAEEPLKARLKLINQSGRFIDDFKIYLHNRDKTEIGNCFDIPIGSSILSLTGSSLKRGKYQASKVKISTQAPSQLFYAWRFVPCEISFYIFPKRTKLDLTTTLQSLDHEFGQSRTQYTEHLHYQAGFSSRNIDWKLYARSETLYWKKYEGSEEEEFVFSFEKLKGDKEEKLSQLSYLIDHAFQGNHTWTLHITGESYGPSKGYQHWQRCLEVLACA